MIKNLFFKLWPWLRIEYSALFDKEWYSSIYGIPKGQAAKHYLEKGYLAGYQPSVYFDGDAYRRKYPDTAQMNPLLHYEMYGRNEGCTVEYKDNAANIFGCNNSSSLPNVTLNTLPDVFTLVGAKIYGREHIRKSKNVFMFSHDMSLTGAPIVLERFASALQKDGYHPIIFSPKDGPLSVDICKKGIPVIIYGAIAENRLIDSYFHCAEFSVVNTVSVPSIGIIRKLNGTNHKALWWVHECNAVYQDFIKAALPENVSDNIHIYCGGWYAQEVLRQYQPGYATNILLYGVPDKTMVRSKNIGDRIVFAIAATLEPRKGQSVAVKMIESLPKAIRDRCSFRFAGRRGDYPDIDALIYRLVNQYPETVEYLGVLSQDEMDRFYGSIDCLISCSLDDPMPVVVTEAWQRGIPTICSEFIGQKRLIDRFNCGIIYENNDYQDLAAKVINFTEGRYDTAKMTKQAFDVFREYFSLPVFEKNVVSVVRKVKECEL